MATKKNEGDFHVALNGVKLSESSRNRIQAGIQKVVMDELAAYFPNPDGDDKPHRFHFGDGVIVVPPKFWWGFILRPILQNEAATIKGLEEKINAQQYVG
ncbi:MAG: hypothetical protein WDO19_08610 [Bacteroidota bacterium]